ncbi:LysR family transcriptional regulator [Dyella flava]|uniref:LysR family transcriptional regulator n=2 Tax=Dyella flava TaxID=1920170 RepID=A0ABS2K436_9GAMM|nr:LysR family transcriptional regulator [Dyella flava]
MELNDIDLNLLVVFNELLIERRVAKVADKLDLTQPSVSNALARLRKLLQDELFLRTPKGMEPTLYASQLAEPISFALNTIRNSLNQHAEFAPATSTRKFTIGMVDLGEIYFLPRLMDKLARVAPGVSVSTVRNTAVNLKDAMEAGQVDLAMGLLPQLKAGFFQRGLFQQDYVCMLRQGHPLQGKRMTLKQFTEADHVVVVSEGTGHAKMDEIIERKGIRRNIRLTVPHFVAVGHILAKTNMIATVPEQYAMACLEPFKLTYVKHPVQLPRIGINIFWHAKAHKEPGNQWLRNLIADMYSESGSL